MFQSGSKRKKQIVRLHNPEAINRYIYRRENVISHLHKLTINQRAKTVFHPCTELYIIG
jgi:hypothetical protein